MLKWPVMVMVDCHLMSNEELAASLELSLFDEKKKRGIVR